MNFSIRFGDLDIEKQSEIEESLKTEEREKLLNEARERVKECPDHVSHLYKKPLKELSLGQVIVDLYILTDDPEEDADEEGYLVDSFVEEIVSKRISRFKLFTIDL